MRGAGGHGERTPKGPKGCSPLDPYEHLPPLRRSPAWGSHEQASMYRSEMLDRSRGAALLPARRPAQARGVLWEAAAREMTTGKNWGQVNRAEMDLAWRTLAKGRPGLSRRAAMALLVRRALDDPAWLHSLPPDPGPLKIGAPGMGVSVKHGDRAALDELWAREWDREPGITRLAIMRRILHGYAIPAAAEADIAANVRPGNGLL